MFLGPRIRHLIWITPVTVWHWPCSLIRVTKKHTNCMRKYSPSTGKRMPMPVRIRPDETFR